MSLEQAIKNDELNKDVFKIYSTKKFVFFCLATLNFFVIYWSFHAWHVIKRVENSRIKPGFRSLCGFLFNGILGYKAINILGTDSPKSNLKAIAFFLVYILMIVINLLIVFIQFFEKSHHFVSLFIPFIISLLFILFNVYNLQLINSIAEKSDEFQIVDKSSFSNLDILISVFGVLILILNFFGILISSK